MAKDTYIRLRCTNEFKQQIEALASKENRTVSNYIENLLKREIEKENKTMKNYYYEVIGNFGNDGEENGTNYKTLADAKKRINELGDQYESYTVLKVSADDKFDFEEVEI